MRILEDTPTNWSEVRAALLHAIRIVELREMAQPAAATRRERPKSTVRRRKR
jgi:hypothetical protein